MVRRLLAPAALLALSLAVALVAGPALATKDAPAPAAPTLTAPLPAWLAPGGRLRLQGTAEPRKPVTVTAGKQVLGRVRAGPRGRFRATLRGPGRSGVVRIRLNGVPAGSPAASASSSGW